jgi:hypothetical protein
MTPLHGKFQKQKNRQRVNYARLHAQPLRHGRQRPVEQTIVLSLLVWIMI